NVPKTRCCASISACCSTTRARRRRRSHATARRSPRTRSSWTRTTTSRFSTRRPAVPGMRFATTARSASSRGRPDGSVVHLEALPLVLGARLSVPADAVHVAEELQAVALGIVEVEGVVAAGPLVLDLAAHVDTLRDQVTADPLERLQAAHLHRDLLDQG